MQFCEFDGLILCGGESSRMGSDKAFVDFGGSPLVTRPIAALENARQIYAVGGDQEALEKLGVGFAHDEASSSGPAMALVTGARQLGPSAAATTVALSCDLPLINRMVVDSLVQARHRCGADVAVLLTEGRAQWLVSAWNHQSLVTRTVVSSASIRELLVELSICYVVNRELSTYAIDADRPQDLEVLRAPSKPTQVVASQ